VAACAAGGDNHDMIDVKTLNAAALKGLGKGDAVKLVAALKAELERSQQALAQRERDIAERDRHIAEHERHAIEREREIKFKDASIERLTFQVAQFRAWKYGARTEAMSAEQRRLFEETLAEDEADLQAQVDALNAQDEASRPASEKRRPRRTALPEHLRRVEHRHEPASTAMCRSSPGSTLGFPRFSGHIE